MSNESASATKWGWQYGVFLWDSLPQPGADRTPVGHLLTKVLSFLGLEQRGVARIWRRFFWRRICFFSQSIVPLRQLYRFQDNITVTGHHSMKQWWLMMAPCHLQEEAQSAGTYDYHKIASSESWREHVCQVMLKRIRWTCKMCRGKL